MSEQVNGASTSSGLSSRRSSISHRRALSGITPRELKTIDDVIPLDRRQKWKKHSAKPIETSDDFESEFVRNVETTLGRSLFNCDTLAAYQATARSLRDTLIVRWNRTQQKHTLDDPKRVYYLSLEFLMGRALDNAALNLGLESDIKNGLDDFGFRFEDVVNREPDAGLGNGGLGRLAACFIDSLCTLDYPAWAYGIRYKYGIFSQKIIDGAQVERPDLWLDFGNPWEIPRPEVSFDVMFYGRVEGDDNKKKWVGGTLVEAKAYDFLVPGFETKNVNTLRLWQAEPSSQFDFERFNEGDYSDAVAEQVDASTISAVLYPNDNFYQGKELRLKQQYFWVAASLSDILRRYKKTQKPWSEFADSCAIQLNDTHPTLAIVELLRLLVDKEGLGWHEAWAITTSTFAYTNHTVMPEALEKWGIDILGNLLPRHLEIVYQINYFFLKDVASKFPGDNDLLNRVSLIEESSPKQVRMAYLAVIASHKVNGVAELHSDLIKTTIFADFVKIFGESHFTNITNGITPRRWLLEANPKLAALIASKLGSIEYIKDLDQLRGIAKYVNDADFRKKWNDVKHANKLRLIELIKSQNPGIEIDPSSLFDVQVKRIHEYKRQQLNLFGIVYRYLYLKSLTPEQRRSVAPRVFVFGGKSAPGYYAAKLIIKLINAVAKTIDSEPEISKYLKVVYIEEYNVSKAQILVAASDISEHISTAGTEASGTSNMKFVLNGGLIIGTVDGANIEIGREIGEENIYYFGHLSESVDEVRAETQNGVQLGDKLSKVFETIDSGVFGDASEFASLLDSIRNHGDYYLVNADFDSYINTQSKIDEDFKDKERWTTKSITSVSKMGFFSSDRAINQYAEEIWDIRPNPVEGPDPLSPKPSHASLRPSTEPVSAAQGTVAARNIPKNKNKTTTAAATAAAATMGASAAALSAAAIAATGNRGQTDSKDSQNTKSYDPTTPGDEGQVKGAYGSYAEQPTTQTSSGTGENTFASYNDKSTAGATMGQNHGDVAAGTAAAAAASAIGSGNSDGYNPITPGDEGQVKGAYGSYADNSSGIATTSSNSGEYYDPTAPGDEGQVKGAYGSYAPSTGIDNTATMSKNVQTDKTFDPLATGAYGSTESHTYDPAAPGDEGQVKGAYGSYAPKSSQVPIQEPSHKYEGLDAAAASAAARSGGAAGGSYKNYDPITGEEQSFSATIDEVAAQGGASAAAKSSGVAGGSYANYDPITGHEPTSFSATIDEEAAAAAAGSAAQNSGAPAGSYANYDPITGHQEPPFSASIDEKAAAAAAGSAGKSSGAPGGSFANYDPITRQAHGTYTEEIDQSAAAAAGSAGKSSGAPGGSYANYDPITSEHQYNPTAPGDESQVKGAYGSYADKPTTNTSSGGASHVKSTQGYTPTGSNSSNGEHIYDPAARGDESQVKGAYGSYKPESTTESTEHHGHKTLGGIVAGTAAAAAAALGLGHKSGETETSSGNAGIHGDSSAFDGSNNSNFSKDTSTAPLRFSKIDSTNPIEASGSYQSGADENVSYDDDMGSKKSKQKNKKRASNVPAGATSKVQAGAPVGGSNSVVADAPISSVETGDETTATYDPLGGQDEPQVTGTYRSLSNKPETSTSETSEAKYDPTAPGDEGQVTGAYGSYVEKPVVAEPASFGSATASEAAYTTSDTVPLASSGTLDSTIAPGNKRTSGIFSEISSASSGDSAGLETEAPGVSGLHRNLVDPSTSTNSVNTAKLDTFAGDKSFTGPSSQEVPLESENTSTWTDKATGLAVGAGAAVVGGAASILASTGLGSNSRETSTPVDTTYKSLDPASRDERYVSELNKPIVTEGDETPTGSTGVGGPVVTDGIHSGEAPIKSFGTSTGGGVVSSDASIVSLDSRTAPIPDTGATVSGRFAPANESSDRKKLYEERRHSRTSLATTGETDFEDAEDLGSPEPTNRANRSYDADSVSSQSTLGKRNTTAAAAAVPVAVSAPASAGTSKAASRPGTATTAATSVGDDKFAGGDGRDLIPTEVLDQPKEEIGGQDPLLSGPPVDKSKVEEVHQEVIAAAKAEGETEGIIRTGAAGVAETSAPGKHANKDDEKLSAPDKKSCRCC